jgi:hypothetical protein
MHWSRRVLGKIQGLDTCLPLAHLSHSLLAKEMRYTLKVTPGTVRHTNSRHAVDPILERGIQHFYKNLKYYCKADIQGLNPDSLACSALYTY